MRDKKTAAVNLLELVPRRTVKWETEPNGSVVLIIPKFKNRFAVRYFMPMLAKPDVRLKLDAYGSFVWNHCDGRTTVLRIAEKMRSEFGPDVEPVYDRVALFVGRLNKEHFVTLKDEHDLTGATYEEPTKIE